MKTTLMWTRNDFFLYEMVLDWSTHEKLTCPYFMDDNNNNNNNNKEFTLINRGKAFFFLPHKRTS
jgi:hypothetical protein